MKRLLVLVLFFSATSYAAGIQKWTDENGQIHYGDSPPAKIKSESVRVSRPPSNPGKALPRFTGSKDEDSTTASNTPQKNEPPEPSAEEASELCAKAEKDLATLNGSARIRLQTSDGTSRLLTQEERDQRKVQTEEDIKRFCK